MPDRRGALAALPAGPVGATPMLDVPLLVDGRPRLLRLKAEWNNPWGSIKDRTAAALFASVVERVDPRAGVIESTSGNLGLALAALCAAHDVRFTAVVDPRASAPLVQRIRELGARVIESTELDGAGGYLLSRLATVRTELARIPRLVWTNQYENPANPAAHMATGAEVSVQAPGAQAVFVPVSTGDTLAGIQRHARQHQMPWRGVGVDLHGSIALGGRAGPRLLSGIGASRRSSFLPVGGPLTPEVEHVTTDEVVAACDWVGREVGVGVGASTGAAVAAALRRMRADPALTDVVCLCPDGADRYQTTVYSAEWRARHAIQPATTWARLEAGIAALEVVS